MIQHQAYTSIIYTLAEAISNISTPSIPLILPASLCEQFEAGGAMSRAQRDGLQGAPPPGQSSTISLFDSLNIGFSNPSQVGIIKIA